MRLEFPHVADPPDVVADAVVFHVGPFQFLAADAFALVDRFEHGAVRVAAAAGIVDFARARLLKKLPEHFHQVVAVDVVAHLFALVAKDSIGRSFHGATHQIGKKTMQFGARMRRAGETAAAKTYRLHAEIISVFLNQHISGDFACAEKRMFRLVNAHRFGNARLIFVAGFDFPALLQFDQRQAVRRIAIYLIRGGEDEDRFGTKLARGFQQVQRADGVDAKIRVRVARRPIMGRLRGRMDDERNVLAEFFEEIFDGVAVADIKIVMLIIRQRRDQLLAVAKGGSRLAKKPLA